MARATTREIRYESDIDKIEHLTGKTVKSWRNDYSTLYQIIVFTDNTILRVHPYEGLNVDNLVYEEIPKSICASCGKDAHASYWDFRGWCNVTNKRFWERVRKVYWHRYLKNK